ncbi:MULTISPECIES: LacI family DNA-binding transcriptional regulator [Pseudomonadota]|uniref:HTH lacI-type domain-containing protein n=1 Tax=Thalassospira alkalitolerans TaxID=1293890 RepID=A0A1Y2LE91_9PROT|nr:LacI family DNA-binding transcriptional regulator [Thalassospira alkalitolerans]OSQ49225.1 hypothetical protein TALK_06535 [Thalassospira alkalitolerans]|tara:strand:- start:43551 stop:44561 length:1011 start_codon:yes stop_codon:yes gene_type:complete
MTPPLGKAATSYDVAILAGVSRSAVSRAFTDGASISTETRKRVMAAAKELGYHVNFLARSLQSRRSSLVGVVASAAESPFRAKQIKITAAELVRRGYCPILLSAETPDDIDNLTSSLFSYNVAGMIITSGTPPESIIAECNRLSIPVVLVNREANVTGADQVSMDINQGGQLAFDLLKSAGVQKFCAISPRIPTYSVNGRIDAYVSRCQKENVPLQMVEIDGQSYASGLHAADQIAAHLDKIDGVFCGTDLIGLGVMDGLRYRHGLRIPEDIQILGFDDIDQTGWLSYNLSTIRQNAGKLVKAAVDAMQQRLEAPASAYQQHIIAVEPVLRATTRK